MSLMLAFLSAVLAVTSVRQAEVSNVRFVTSRLAVVREKGATRARIGGAIRVNLSFRRASARMPILRIFCLCEEQGQLVCRRGLWDRLETYRPLDRGEVTRLFKEAGYVPARERQDEDLSDPKLISTLTSAVSREGYAAATYGESISDRGFFDLKPTKDPPRLLLYCLEIWQNGTKVAAYESSRSGLGPLGIPEDWTAWRRYPRLFRYEDR